MFQWNWFRHLYFFKDKKQGENLVNFPRAEHKLLEIEIYLLNQKKIPFGPLKIFLLQWYAKSYTFQVFWQNWWAKESATTYTSLRNETANKKQTAPVSKSLKNVSTLTHWEKGQQQHTCLHKVSHTHTPHHTTPHHTTQNTCSRTHTYTHMHTQTHKTNLPMSPPVYVHISRTAWKKSVRWQRGLEWWQGVGWPDFVGLTEMCCCPVHCARLLQLCFLFAVVRTMSHQLLMSGWVFCLHFPNLSIYFSSLFRGMFFRAVIRKAKRVSIFYATVLFVLFGDQFFKKQLSAETWSNILWC